MQEKTDAELVTLARSDDKDAFCLLIERYYLMAFSIALRFTANQEAARDLLQEAMLRAYLSLDQLHDEARFKNWFYGIALNVCRAWLGEQRTHIVSLEAQGDDWHCESIFPCHAFLDPQEVVEEQELQSLVQEAVQALSPKNRTAALLFYYEDLSIQEIAASLNISVTAVKSRLHKGREQLKHYLKAIYPEMERITPGKRRKTMTRVTIAKVVPQENRILVALLDEQEQRILPLWLGLFESHALVLQMARSALQKNVASLEPSTIDFTATLLQALGGTVEEMRIEALQDNVLYAKVHLRNQQGSQEIKARLGDALSLAARMNSPIFVAEDVFERLSILLPKNGSTLDQRIDTVVSKLGTVPVAQQPPKPRIRHPENLRFEQGLERWEVRGSHLFDTTSSHWQDYVSGTDMSGPNGTASGYLKANGAEPIGYANLRQGILADDYRGKGVRLSADIKTAGIEQRAGLYLRIVDPARSLTIDDRQEAVFVGTQDWTRYETTIDVAQDSVFILFGLILYGKGQVWLANVQLEAI